MVRQKELIDRLDILNNKMLDYVRYRRSLFSNYFITSLYTYIVILNVVDVINYTIFDI